MEVLIDNSLFAGFMRQYAPDRQEHAAFVARFPEHRQIDRISTAQFLNALVLFGGVTLEVEPREDMHDDDGDDQERVKQWAHKLMDLLPVGIQNAIKLVDEDSDAHLLEQTAISQTVELYAQRTPERKALFVKGHIPYVYTSPEYIYRARFNAVDSAALLDDRELAHAMFLHRGVRLQQSAQKRGMIYQPYWYRANLLAKASPLLYEEPLTDGLYTVRLPSRRAIGHAQTEYMNQLNEAYYELISRCSFAKPDHEFPFVGAAILDAAHGDVGRALENAIVQREVFEDSAKKWRDLMQAIAAGRRLDADQLAGEIKRQIQQAAGPRMPIQSKSYDKVGSASFSVLATAAGVVVEKVYGKIAGKLTEVTLKAVLDVVPDSAKEWFRQQAERVVQSVTSNPYRMLLTQHLNALAVWE